MLPPSWARQQLPALPLWFLALVYFAGVGDIFVILGGVCNSWWWSAWLLFFSPAWRGGETSSGKLILVCTGVKSKGSVSQGLPIHVPRQLFYKRKKKVISFFNGSDLHKKRWEGRRPCTDQQVWEL